MRKGRVDDCIESLCQKGCNAVREDIAALEQGRSLPETRGLTSEEALAVLSELRSIMEVYGDVCRTPF
ncbi:MAG: hypothetical protein PVG98_04970 [Chromatiales bacterium]|jgi:hypothetical protein